MLLAGLSLLLYQPFSSWYGQGYNKIIPWTSDRTPFWSYLTHWGVFLFIIVSWMAWETVDWMATTPVSALNRLRPYAGLIRAGLAALVIMIAVLLVTGVQIAWLALPLAVWAGVLLFRPGLPDAKRAVLFMIGTALLLTLFVEVAVLQGDIDRMNTVFKFYLQAWTLLGLSAAASLVWLLPTFALSWRPALKNAWQVALVVLVAGAALFPLMASPDKIRDRMAKDAPPSLDGMAYMAYASYSESETPMDLSQDYRAIQWMQRNVKGSPVIVEANTPEYRWGTRFTIYTGLPGVVGWNWHQRQQRAVTPDSWVFDRVDAIGAFYNADNRAEVEKFIQRYSVKYIIVGQLERILYTASGIEKFAEWNGDLWHEVYRDGQTVIYEIAKLGFRFMILNLITWYLVVALAGWLVFPLAYRVFAFLPDRGLALSRPLGLLLWGYTYWLLVSLKVLQNDAGGAVFSLLLVAGLSLWQLLRDRQRPVNRWGEIAGWLREQRGLVLATELLFLALFVFWALVRAANPDASGTEKPMELAFINSILRSPAFPPSDPWLSGYAISYYYFGYVMVALLARLTGTPGSIAFNLALITWFAMTGLAAYSLLYNLLALRGKEMAGQVRARTAALLAPLFILFVSNLEGFLEMLHARGLFWQQGSGGVGSSAFWSWLNIQELVQPPAPPLSWVPERATGIWWWRASRVLQDFDLGNQSREIIDEFPMFSYLLGDLHPHLLAMPFVLLAIGLALNAYLRCRENTQPGFQMETWFRSLEFWLAAVVLGGLAFLNTWDFPIYVALFAASVDRASSAAPPLDKIKEHIHPQAQGHEHQSQGHGQGKGAFVVFQGHGGGHGAGKAFDVAAKHHRDADLGNHPAKGGNDGGGDAEPAFAQHHQGGLPAIGAQRPGGLAVALVDPADGGDGQGGDQRHNEDELADDHRLLGVQQVQGAEDAAPGNEDIDEQADHHRRQGQEGVEQGDDDPLARQAAVGDGKSGRNAHQSREHRGQATDRERDADNGQQLRIERPGQTAGGKKALKEKGHGLEQAKRW